MQLMLPEVSPKIQWNDDVAGIRVIAEILKVFRVVL